MFQSKWIDEEKTWRKLKNLWEHCFLALKLLKMRRRELNGGERGTARSRMIPDYVNQSISSYLFIYCSVCYNQNCLLGLNKIPGPDPQQSTLTIKNSP